MKLLVAIQCCFPVADTCLVYVYAWKRFLDRYAQNFNCNFAFINNGLNPQRFTDIVKPYKAAHVPRFLNEIAWDTDSAFYTFNTFKDQYDYIMRVENDAFLTVENIEAFIKFLEKNLDIDLVSATNYPRTVTNTSGDPNFILDTSRGNPSQYYWLPWHYPTLNNDLYIFKTEIFKQALIKYNKYCCAPFAHTPFNTSFLTYGKICEVLKYDDTVFLPKYKDVRVRVDGSINVDFWTIFCSLRPQVAGIVNYDQKSFQCKGHLLSYNLARRYKSFKEAVDLHNECFPYIRTVIAPYLHTGNAYVSDCYTGNNNPHLNHPNTIGQFQAASKTFTVLHYCLLLLLARSSGDEGILTKLKNTMEPWIKSNNIDYQKIMEIYEDLYVFYQEPLKGYLSQSNIEKYSHVLKDI